MKKAAGVDASTFVKKSWSKLYADKLGVAKLATFLTETSNLAYDVNELDSDKLKTVSIDV